MSFGQRSITTGSPGEIGPEPMSCPTALCGPCETMNSSVTIPRAVKTAAIAPLIRSEVSGSPSTTSPAFLTVTGPNVTSPVAISRCFSASTTSLVVFWMALASGP